MIKKIIATILLGALTFSFAGCAFADGFKQGYEDATKDKTEDKETNSTEETENKEETKDSKEDTSKEDSNTKEEKDNNTKENNSQEQTNTSENKQEYKSIRDINTAKVYSGTNKDIGTRAYAQYDPDTLSDEELIRFYNEKIKDSDYNYFTLVNIKDGTKGIVFSGCGNLGDKGSIDKGGMCTNSEELLEIKDNEVKHIK